MKNGIIALTVAGALFVGVQLLSASGDIGATLVKTCGRCHPAARVCSALGSKDKAGWESTIKRMQEKGAALDAQQSGEAAEYLAGLKAGTGAVCGK